MNPRLIALSGPYKGQVFPITGEKLTIGRAAHNRIPLDDELVSDSHCAVWLQNGRAYVRDGDSRNGTWVNERACRDHFYEHFDRTDIGLSRFLFADADIPAEAVTELMEDASRRTREIETLRADYSVRDEAAVHYRNLLKAFMEMVKKLNRPADTHELHNGLLDLTFEAVPALRGAIRLNGHRIGPDPDDFVSQTYRERGSDGPASFTPSSKVLHELYSRPRPVINNDITPILCAPLMFSGKIRGVLYLEGTSHRKGFEPEHLRLIECIADVVVLGIGTAGSFESVSDARDVLLEERRPDDEMVGSSEALAKVRDGIRRVARSDATVLITGETGTGKELIARGIHQMSARRDKPFVAINCAAITESLLESELFGHVKGAFTGAASARKGKFRKAEGGTLFLDEIGEMGPDLQAKLLRVLQEREFEPVGGDETVTVDVRIIAATRVNLDEAIRQNEFRDDLFHRLNVLTIEAPPLRDRKEDIPLLAAHFLAKYAPGAGKELAADAMEALMAFAWPGNIRQLEGAIQAALVYADSDIITADNLPKSIKASAQTPMSLRKKGQTAHKQAQRAELLKRMDVNGGSVREAARFLSISLTYAYRLLEEA